MSYSASNKISTVCSPSLGAGLTISLGVFANRAAGLACLTSPKDSYFVLRIESLASICSFSRSERTSKWNELIRIDEELNKFKI